MDFINVLISSVLALIMFGIGASLKPSDFRNVFLYPKALLTGLGLQMIFLPIFVFFIAFFSNLSPLLKVGLFIIALCPGGTTSNFISYLIRAEVALSISLTIINSIIILFTIPTLSSFALDYFIHAKTDIQLPFFQTIAQIFIITLLPAALGTLFNLKFADFSNRIQQPLKYINMVLLALVFGIKFFAGESSGGSGISLEDVINILPYALLVNIGSIIISYYFSRSIDIDIRQATTIGIEVGLQNTTLALLVTSTLIGSDEMSKPALVFAIFSFFTTLLFAWLSMKQLKA